MIVDKLVSDGQPINWYNIVTSECKGYPVHLVDISEDELVVDIGANVGGFWNAWHHRFRNWLSVEASSWNCELYKQNTGLDVTHNKAVWDSNDKILKLQSYIVNGNKTESGSFGVKEFVYENGCGWQGDYEEVQTIDYKTLLGDKEIGLLKIDCEGAEFEFLIDADLSNCKYIVGEFHNFLGGVNQMKLFTHIGGTHTQIYSDGDGVNSHFVKLFKRK